MRKGLEVGRGDRPGEAPESVEHQSEWSGTQVMGSVELPRAHTLPATAGD